MRPHLFFQTSVFKLTLVVLMVAACYLTAFPQNWTQYDQGTPPQHAAGISPVGSYVSADLGTVNASNGSLNINLPFGTVGGRGFNIPLSLNYSSKVWSIAHDTTFDPNRDSKGVGGDVTVAYATYGQAESWVDIYNRLAAGWTIGGVPQLKAQFMGIWDSSCDNGLPYWGLIDEKVN